MIIEACRVLADILVMGTYAAMLAHIWFETLGDAAVISAKDVLLPSLHETKQR